MHESSGLSHLGPPGDIDIFLERADCILEVACTVRSAITAARHCHVMPLTPISVARSRAARGAARPGRRLHHRPAALNRADGPDDDRPPFEVAVEVIDQGQYAGITPAGRLLQAVQADRLQVTRKAAYGSASAALAGRWTTICKISSTEPPRNGTRPVMIQ